MTERVLCLKDREVRGLLDGRVSALARPVKPAPTLERGVWRFKPKPPVDINVDHLTNHALLRRYSPFGAPGDVLVCKETLRRKRNHPSMPADYITYVATITGVSNANPNGQSLCHRPIWTWKRNVLPAPCTPRWSVRLFAKVKSVRAVQMRKCKRHFEWDKYFPKHPADPDRWIWYAEIEQQEEALL